VLSDSPYNSDGFILRPPVGFAVGMVSALLMLPVLFALQPASGLLLQDVLANAGIIVFSGTADPHNLKIAGLVVHLLVGGLFGLLYALCQIRAPNKGLIGVGISYGIVLWAFGSFLTQWFYREALSTVMHTWAWLVASIAYGLILSLVAIWSEHHRPKENLVIPID
jgi:hypothetical protein